jgi:glycosyltransferase involved in cell wall biosynthesis
MRICAIIKYPPIQGGVSARSYWTVRALAERGHQVNVVTNASEVEDAYRLWIPPEDSAMLESTFDNGGYVRVWPTRIGGGRSLKHIPQSNPFVSKLASVATEVVRSEKCEVIFSYYFEPYGMSAYLASTWTDVPFVVQHAGSDKGRLMNHPELSTAYREMLRRASLIITPSDQTFVGLGISARGLARPPRSASFLPRSYFSPNVQPLDIDRLLAHVGSHPFIEQRKPWPSDRPVIGIYGKIGRTKGSFDLVAALEVAASRGRKFNVLAMVGGNDRDRFVGAVRDAGLADRTWFLPLLPHWRVSQFIRTCSAVCFLERRFAIRSHHPMVAQEILACGVCAIISREIADKQLFREQIIDRFNALVVDDPQDHQVLANVITRVIDAPDEARQIGIEGLTILGPEIQTQLGAEYEEFLRQAVKGTARSWTTPTRENPDPRVGLVNLLKINAPATLRLFSEEIQEIMRSSPSGTAGPSTLIEIYEWMGVLLRIVEGSSRASHVEILKCERDLLWSGIDLESRIGESQFKAPSIKIATKLLEDDDFKPVKSKWTKIAEYPANIELLLSIARNGGEPPDADPVRKAYAFVKRGNLSPKFLKLDELGGRLFEMSDGTLTLGEIRSLLVRENIQYSAIFRDTVSALSRNFVIEAPARELSPGDARLNQLTLRGGSEWQKPIRVKLLKKKVN